MQTDDNIFLQNVTVVAPERTIGLRELNIHTSDRIAFKRCRRRWNWSSPLRLHLRQKEQRRPLWFGTGIHFVLEDFHGHHLYSSPVDAWNDYVSATLQHFGEEDMPNDWRSLQELGQGVVDYYPKWLRGRDALETVWIDGEPQCEINFKIPIPVDPQILSRLGVDIVYYNGTLDGVCYTPFGSLAIREYKSAAQIFKAHYLSDPQITAYTWGAQILYSQPVVGCYYYQFLKDSPEEPKLLSSGRISSNKQMRTTHRMYRDVLLRLYGKVANAPSDNIDHLNYLAALEDENGDKFITRDFITRNEHTLQAEGVKILMEMEDMLNEDLPLYPNPTRECAQYKCDFLDACTSLDDGSDWESILEEDFTTQKDQERDPWRKYLHQVKPYKELILPNPPQSLLLARQSLVEGNLQL